MQLSKFECENFRVGLKNYAEVLESANDYLVCVPPPYMVGNFVKAVTIPERPQIDHAKFAEQMSEHEDWMILYNYHENLYSLYPEHEIIMLDSACRPTNKRESAVEVVILGS